MITVWVEVIKQMPEIMAKNILRSEKDPSKLNMNVITPAGDAGGPKVWGLEIEIDNSRRRERKRREGVGDIGGMIVKWIYYK